MFVSLRGTPTWRLHTKLYKFVWNILSNNSSTEYRTDLTLGRVSYLFTIYDISISWLHSWNGFNFFSRTRQWRDSENRQYQQIRRPWKQDWRDKRLSKPCNWIWKVELVNLIPRSLMPSWLQFAAENHERFRTETLKLTNNPFYDVFRSSRDAMYANVFGQTFLHCNGSTTPHVPAVDLGQSSFTVALWIKAVVNANVSKNILVAHKQLRIYWNAKRRLQAKLHLSNEEDFYLGTQWVCLCCNSCLSSFRQFLKFEINKMGSESWSCIYSQSNEKPASKLVLLLCVFFSR